MATAYRLQCALCSATYEPDARSGSCVCGGRLQVTYDLRSLRNTLQKGQLVAGPGSLWRYQSLLPESGPPVTLGEGFTPLLPLRSLGAKLGYAHLWLKDDGRGPAVSFAARGTSIAMTMARALGATEFVVACSADEASTLAIYAVAAGIKAHIFVPSDISKTNYVASMAAGAAVTLMEGSVDDWRRQASERNRAEDWFDFANVTEPYRIEGEKTIGFEIAEQFAWSLPDAILVPDGNGSVSFALSKAFSELEQLGWIHGKRPKIIAVNTENRASSMDAALELAGMEGIFAALDAGACVGALQGMLESGVLNASERVVVLNTASGFKHIEAYAKRFIRASGSEQDKLGGLITPR